MRWSTMNGDAESLKEAYPLVLVYTDAEAGLAEVNDPQTPPLRRQNIRKRSL